MENYVSVYLGVDKSRMMCFREEIADFTEEDISTVRFWRKLVLRQNSTVAVFNSFKTTETGCQKVKHLAWCLETTEIR